MEKGNTTKASSSKTNGSDSKNKQDVTNKHLRLPRAKDNLSPRPDTRRKSNPPRNREYFVKRPRNKCGGKDYERYRSEVADGSVYESSTKQGCKKTNLNHLLNFSLVSNNSWDGSSRRPIYNKQKLPRYNKELFLQANCQFIARNDGDYKVHQKNPDILVEWSLIEEIRLPCHEVPLCPICLYIPVAAKITRCGHIYCWPCMLHYLALTDKTWQKCPICFEAVHKTDLKSVSLQMRKCFTVGDEITMYLMKREKGTLIAMPVTHQKISQPQSSAENVDVVARFQKLLLADHSEVKSILNRERNELDEAYAHEKDTPEACFIESALKLLDEREHVLNATLGKEQHNPHEDLAEKVSNAHVRKHLTSISSIESIESLNSDANGCAAKLGSSSNADCTLQTSLTDSDGKAVSYFYQAEDGQHIYLHNLNVRMLLKEYGSLEFAPPIITAKLVEIERVSMTEVLRKRLRYLQHLPLTCEFQVVELCFSDQVSESTMAQFESEIRKRSKNRNRKARDEARRERMIQQEENKKLGIYPKANYNINSIHQFPAYNPEDFLSLSPPQQESNASNHWVTNSSPEVLETNSAIACNNNNEDLVYDDTKQTVTSFAQMLKDGPKTFTDTPKKIKANADVSRHNSTEVAADDEMFNPVPVGHLSFSDAIQAALDSVTLQDYLDENQSSSKKKKKKGKKQQQLLFTTSMCRNK